MRFYAQGLVLLTTGLAALLLLAGCGGGHQLVATPTPYVPVPIVTGTPVTQALTGAAGQSVATSITGTTLVLPDGATGSLTLAPILSGPPRPTDGGQGVRITAPAGAHVQLQVTVPDGEVAHCYVFGTMAGCLDGGTAPRTARWVPITDGSHVGNVYTFDMPIATDVPAEELLTRLGGGGAIDSWVDHGNLARMRAIATKARVDISAALETLPEPLRSTAIAAYQGDMAPTIAECSETDGSYYTGFGWVFSSRVCPYLAYRVTATDDVIAHETGHYLTHLLAGNAKFRTISDLAPDANHALGTLYDGRKTITEEYAYFQQFLTQGMVQSSSPMSGSWLAVLSGKTPAQVDYPSVEGFGCSLMAALTRATVDTLRDFAKQATPTPAGALSKGEVLAVYADGASTIDALATVLETRMKAKGQGEAFRVIAERLGWSYQATGHVLGNKLTMQGVKVTPFVKVTQNGVTTTYTTSSVTTDAGGRFVLPRVFFGQGMLRLEYGGKTYDMPYTIDRAKSTVSIQTIPDIAISPPFAREMVWVPGGTFTMGTTYNNFTQEPLTQLVTLTGYWIDKYEVTVAQYRAFCAATGNRLPSWPGDVNENAFSWEGKSGWDDPALQQHPIVGVSWSAAKAYADWARLKLPTEAQWEYAARGPAGNNYPWGGTATEADPVNGWDQTKCVNYYNSPYVGKSTWPVGSFPAGVSWCGANDLAGNAYEWCADYFDGEGYASNYSTTPITNPTGPTSTPLGRRAVRGGAWRIGEEHYCRSAKRGCAYDENNIINPEIGFRCVSTAPGP